jgi:peroxiredoxin Q/BCP
MSSLQKGGKAPDFDLETANGERVRLSSFAGVPVVVYFFPKAATAGCTQQAVDFTDALPEFQAYGAPIIGISADPAPAQARFHAKYDIGVILAADPDHQAIGPYGVWTEKSMYGRKFMGIERTTFLIGADGKIAEAWRKVRVKGHVAAVLSAVAALSRPPGS